MAQNVAQLVFSKLKRNFHLLKKSRPKILATFVIFKILLEKVAQNIDNFCHFQNTTLIKNNNPLKSAMFP
jgi:hypothetical protein